MPTTIPAPVESWFVDFARSHGWRETGGPRMHEIKMEHSRRVQADCLAMAAELGWSGDHLHAAELLGLFHDVARFPQFARYGTLMDRQSVDHGEYGFEILQTAPITSTFPAAFRSAILTGVRFHNRKTMPDSLDAVTFDLLRLIRDADKLDILKVIRDVAEADDYDRHPELLLGMDRHGPPTPVLIREILDHRGGSYANVHSLMDLHLLRLTWAYDLNYPITQRRLIERDLYRDLFATRHPNPDVETIKRQVREFLADQPIR